MVRVDQPSQAGLVVTAGAVVSVAEGKQGRPDPVVSL